MRRIPQAPWIRTAGIAGMLSLAVFIAALARAIHVPPVEASENVATAALVRSTATPPVPEIDLGAVGANGIFQPDRNALPYRYRMPGDPEPTDGLAPEPAKPVVLGTVISTEGDHFATCQLPGGRPTVVRVGSKLGEYTVKAIERTKVVFKNAAGTIIEVSATRPGPSS